MHSSGAAAYAPGGAQSRVAAETGSTLTLAIASGTAACGSGTADSRRRAAPAPRGLTAACCLQPRSHYVNRHAVCACACDCSCLYLRLGGGHAPWSIRQSQKRVRVAVTAAAAVPLATSWLAAACHGMQRHQVSPWLRWR